MAMNPTVIKQILAKNVVAVDIGYGFVKAIGANGDRVIFPSYVGEAISRMGNNLFANDGVNELENIEIVYNGQRKFVGELAVKESIVTPTFDTDRKNDVTNILLNIAIQLVHPSDEPVYLVTGLPLDFYKEEAKSFQNYIEGEQKEIKWLTGSRQGETVQTKIQKALVFPQGAAAILAVLTNSEGRYTHPDMMFNGSLIAMIDIGFRTTDIIVVEVKENGSIVPVNRYSTTLNDLGMSTLRQAIINKYEETTGGKKISERFIQQALKGEQLSANGRKIDFKETLEQAKVTLAANIASGVKALWREDSELFSGIFLAGGGAIALEEEMQKAFNDSLIKTQESQYANTIGYLRYGKPIFKRYLEKQIGQEVNS